MQDIAIELKLTPATVSRALHDHPRISKETKQLVLEAAKRLNYRRNKIASSVRTGRSHTIGVIIPSARINFFGSVVHGIETIARDHGYHTLIYQSEESVQLEKEAIETFLGARVDGILASLAKEENDFAHYVELKQANFPLVLFDRFVDSLNIPSVVIDDYKGGFYATEHLISQGYKRIAHLAGPQRFQTFQNRQKGYIDALKKNGLPIDETLIYVGDISIEAGRAATDYFMDMTNPPDAVFAVEDFSALGVIKRLKERNIKIPGEVGIIGFANEFFDEHITPSLSSIDQQTVTMGQEAFSMLLKIIEKTSGTTEAVPKTVLDPIPYYRESSLQQKVEVKQAAFSGNSKENNHPVIT